MTAIPASDGTFHGLTARDADRLIAEIVTPVWNGLERFRNYHHPAGCRTSARQMLAYLHGGPQVGDCNPDCVDLLTETLLQVLKKIQGEREPIRNLGGYATAVTATFAKDLLRRQNADASGAAKPDRRDGVPGRIIRALPSGVDPGLLGALLKDAARRGPVPPSGWQLDALAAQYQNSHPAIEASAAMLAVMRDIEIVLATARRVAGPQWVARYFDEPRQLRRARYQSIPIVSGYGVDDEFGIQVAVPDDEADVTLIAIRSGLRAAFADRLFIGEPVDAMRSALAALAPAGGQSGLTRGQLTALAVDLVAEMLITAIGIDPDSHMLSWLPDDLAARRLLERVCHAPRGSGRRLPDAFMKRVLAVLAPLADPERAARAREA